MTDVIVEGPGPRRIWIREHPWAAAAAAVLLLLVVLVILRNHRAPEEPPEETAVVVASTETVAVQTFAITVSALGTVETQPGGEARVAAPAQTVVSRIHVAEGQTVRAGDPLIELDESVFRARVRQAEAAAEAAQRAHDRARRLVEGGISPRKDLESAEADLARANAELTEARRIASLAVLRSPINGVVTSLDVALAQPVDANQPLVQIVNPSRLAVLFRLSPTDAGRVAVGAQVALSTPASGTETAALPLGEGKVQGISAAVDSTGGGVEVRVAVASPTRLLRVGESVSGTIILAEHPNAVVVPVAALVPGEEGTHVFVVNGQGIAHATPVRVGERSEDRAEILSGLHGGERVVTQGAYGVSDGARIRSEAEAKAEHDSAPAGPEKP